MGTGCSTNHLGLSCKLLNIGNPNIYKYVVFKYMGDILPMSNNKQYDFQLFVLAETATDIEKPEVTVTSVASNPGWRKSVSKLGRLKHIARLTPGNP